MLILPQKYKFISLILIKQDEQKITENYFVSHGLRPPPFSFEYKTKEIEDTTKELSIEFFYKKSIHQ